MILPLRIRLFLPKNRTSLLKPQMIPAAQITMEGILAAVLEEIPVAQVPITLEEAVGAEAEAAAEEAAASAARQVQPGEAVQQEIWEL